MISSTGKKRGRPQGRHRMRNGTEIQGLIRRGDGRWKVSATGQTFVEPDEELAVARFHEILGKNRPSNLGTVQVHRDAVEAMIDLAHRTIDAGCSLQASVTPLPSNGDDGDNDRTGSGYAISDETLSPEQWRWLRKQLVRNRKWVAERVGVEQIGWLPNLVKPALSPTLDELIECYAAKQGITREEVTRCRHFWKEFTDIIGLKTIGELEHEHIERYEAKVADMDLAPKSVKHRYTRIRTVIAYAMKRGKGQDDCRRALDKLAMLEVENVHSLDPNPIAPADFWKIQAAAVAAGDKTFAALMLFALNAALYSSEIGAVRWEDVDLNRGEFATRRNKTKVPRVCCLWPETVKALKALARDRETIFNTRVQPYQRFSIHREWTRYRTDANVKEGVTFAMLRDAAFTTACRTSVDQARVLAGHRLPGAVDHYVLRNPRFVSDVCGAIRQEFYGAKKRKQK